MTVTPIRTRLFREGESLADFILQHIPRLRDGSMIAVTSKIAALAQGRVVSLESPKAKDRRIVAESQIAIRTPWCWLTKTKGEWCANAGVDESNARGKLILLPKNPQKTAYDLLAEIKRRSRRRRLGLILTDTRLYPMRVGVMGVALGYAGFYGLKDYRGKQDLFGRKLKMTQINVANALAVAAVLAMGEGAERQPLALIQGAPVEFTTKKFFGAELTIDPCSDFYRYAYRACRKHKQRSKRRLHPR